MVPPKGPCPNEKIPEDTRGITVVVVVEKLEKEEGGERLIL